MPIEILELIVKAKIGEEQAPTPPAGGKKTVSDPQVDQIELALEHMQEFLKRKKER